MGVQLIPGIYDTDVASDGLCIDTPRGPVDLIAIAHVKAGRFSPLTEAEVTFLAHDLGPAKISGRQAVGTADYQLRQRVAKALGITGRELGALIQKRLRRDRREQEQRERTRQHGQLARELAGMTGGQA